MSLLQNELLSLESELRELEMCDEQVHTEESGDERPRRHVPDIPFGRRDHATIREPSELHLNDQSSIVEAAEQSVGDMQHVTKNSKCRPVTSTIITLVPKPQDKTGSHDKSSVKLKPATFNGTVHWTDYKEHFDACMEINGWTDKEKGLYPAVSLRGQAQGVFGNLSTKANDYVELSNVLQEIFAPPNQMELYRVQLKERRQKESVFD